MDISFALPNISRVIAACCNRIQANIFHEQLLLVNTQELDLPWVTNWSTQTC